MDNQLADKFSKEGFVAVPEVFSSEVLEPVSAALTKVGDSESVPVYYDQSGQIRRMEHFTRKNVVVEDISERTRELLNDVVGLEFVLFKDKYNFKPPGGEGFFAHYDGIFQFKDPAGVVCNGWHHYSSRFVSALIALDDFTEHNGALEISPAHHGDFETLLARTQGDGSPYLRPEVESASTFQPIIMKKGGVALFEHSCPHRSGANLSASPRGSLYLTYSLAEKGDFYEQYFEDKSRSGNEGKALQGERFEG